MNATTSDVFGDEQPGNIGSADNKQPKQSFLISPRRAETDTSSPQTHEDGEGQVDAVDNKVTRYDYDRPETPTGAVESGTRLSGCRELGNHLIGIRTSHTQPIKVDLIEGCCQSPTIIAGQLRPAPHHVENPDHCFFGLVTTGTKFVASNNVQA